MSDPFEGPASERWIEPFGAFLVGEGILAKAAVQRAARLAAALDIRVGWLAVACGYMSAREMYAVLSEAQDRQELFGEQAVELGALTARQVGELLALQRSPFRLFIHCLLLSHEVEGPVLHELLDQFVHREGLEPPTQLSAEADMCIGARSLRLADAQLWRKLDGVRTLSTLPSVVSRVLDMVERPDVALEELADTIEHDPSLCAQLLRVATSTLPWHRLCVASVRDVVESLGGPVVQQLVLTTSVGSTFSEATLARARALWEHSLRAAVWCRTLQRPLGLEADPFLHGLLHELGNLVLLQAFPQECERVDELARGDASREQAEREIFGTTHGDVGVYVCRSWKLPEAIGQAALYHSTPTVLLRQVPDLLPSTRAVHAACRLAGTARGLGTPYLDAAFQEFHGLDLDTIARLAPGVEEQAAALIARLGD